jgi:hypothetical protein
MLRAISLVKPLDAEVLMNLLLVCGLDLMRVGIRFPSVLKASQERPAVSFVVSLNPVIGRLPVAQHRMAWIPPAWVTSTLQVTAPCGVLRHSGNVRPSRSLTDALEESVTDHLFESAVRANHQ